MSLPRRANLQYARSSHGRQTWVQIVSRHFFCCCYSDWMWKILSSVSVPWRGNLQFASWTWVQIVSCHLFVAAVLIKCSKYRVLYAMKRKFAVRKLSVRAGCNNACKSCLRFLVSGWYKHCKFVWVSSGCRENENTSQFSAKVNSFPEKLRFSFHQVLGYNLLH